LTIAAVIVAIASFLLPVRTEGGAAHFATPPSHQEFIDGM
jgi:hypothetical protein